MRQATSLTVLSLPLLCCTGSPTTFGNRNSGAGSYGANYMPVPGEPAGPQLEVSPMTRTVPPATLLGALATADTADEVPLQVEPGVLELMWGTQRTKSSTDYSKYPKLDLASLDLQQATSLAADTVAWGSHADSEYVVPQIEKMPLRDQGERLTCSAFAAIGQLEALLIEKYDLDGLDLSEQKFYFLSKPEHWANGGDVDNGGSAFGKGIAVSAKHEPISGVTYGTDWPEYSIPLESQCAYNRDLGRTDLQMKLPLRESCHSGLVKTTDFASALNQSSLQIRTAQQMYDMVRAGKPVIVLTQVTANYEKNDGMITQAAESGAGPTANLGHAYLVVGVRKLSESRYPNEGGMCFIVRNSWGAGWGVQGTSCMTLAWFNAHRVGDAYATVLDAELDTQAHDALVAEGFAAPDNPLDPEGYDSNINAELSAVGYRRGVASVKPLEFLDSTPHSKDMKLGHWLSQDETYYRVLYLKRGSEFVMRGLLAGGEGKTTRDIVLRQESGKLYFDHGVFGALQVGTLDESTADRVRITICSGPFAPVCELHYLSDSNELLLGLSSMQYTTPPAAAPYGWQQLFKNAQLTVEYSLPQELPRKIDLRLRIGDKTSNPRRFSLEGASGAIIFGNKRIGSLYGRALCTGDFAGICRFAFDGTDFRVLYRGTKR